MDESAIIEEEKDVNAVSVLWYMIRAHRPAMFKAITYGILSSALQLGPAVGVALVVDALYKGDTMIAIYYALAIVVSAVLSAILFAFSTLNSHIIAADTQAEIRKIIAEKLFRVPLGYFRRHSRESIKKLIIDDVGDLEDGIAHLIPEFTSALITPLCILLVMLFLHPLLALAAILPTLLGFMAFAIIIRGCGEINQRFYHSKTDISETIDEVIGAIPTVKSYNKEGSVLKRVNQSFVAFKALIDDWIDAMMVKSSWFYLLTSSNLLIVAPIGYWLYQNNVISFSLLIFFLLASLSFSTMTSALFGIMTRMRGQEGAIKRYQALMSEPELDVLKPCQDGQIRDHTIAFKEVSFSYLSAPNKQRRQNQHQPHFLEKKHTLDTLFKNLNLQLPQGSFTAIVGPSGSGKSTLAYLLARFWDVQAGSITIGGVDIRNLSTEKLSGLTAFVLQDVFIFTRSVRDNIALGKSGASQDDIVAAAKSAYAHEFIQALPQGYDTVLNNGYGLSLGQKQRISIARALIKNAPILLLDEATAYADPQSEVEIQKALNHLMRDRTVVVITHRLSAITGADQIFFLNNGEIVEQGTHESLVQRNDLYASQWRSHMIAKNFTLISKQADAGVKVK